MIEGMIAIGNGEKCPYCDSIMENNNIDGKEMIWHMQSDHHDEFLAQLFPEKDNASKEGESPDNDKMIKKGKEL